MVETGVISKSGTSRAARYHLAATAPAGPPEKHAPAQSDRVVPLSKLGGEIARLVTRRPERRTPVGYSRNFLDGYRPNWSS